MARQRMGFLAAIAPALLGVACGARSGLIVEDIDATVDSDSGSVDTRDDAAVDVPADTTIDASHDADDSSAEVVDAIDEETPPLGDAVEIAIGGDDDCARTSDGRVRCWGLNEFGIVGDGTTTVRKSPGPPIPKLTGVVQLSMWGNGACALRGDGTVACWGRVDTGLLGDGVFPLPEPSIAAPTTIPGIRGAVQVDLGVDACALMPDGTMTCWGGCETGDRPTCPTITPSTLVGIDHVAHMISGWLFRCALRTTGDVWCWGDNRDGELGDGTSMDRTTPAPVPGLTDVRSLAGGGVEGRGVCAAKNDGSVWCWGQRLKDGEFQTVRTPERVGGVGVSIDALATYSTNSCIIGTGALECWGSNVWNELGVPGSPPVATPIIVPSLTGVRAVAIGGYGMAASPGLRVCAIPEDGVPRCWAGPLVGDGSDTARSAPTPVDW